MREGRFYSFEEVQQLKYRWPDVGINSHDFGRLPHYERLRQMALGYARSAKSLCVELGENPDRLDWPRASVVLFCFYQAVELFLKACILYRSPGERLGHHSAPDLMLACPPHGGHLEGHRVPFARRPFSCARRCT
jgi:hypothetical protein